MIILRMFAKVRWLLSIVSLAFNLELQDDLFLFSSFCQHKSLFAHSSRPFILAHIKVDASLDFLRNDQAAAAWALWVVYVDHQIGHFARQEEVFRHNDLHSNGLTASQTYSFVEGYSYIEAGVVDYWANWGDMNALSRPDLTLSPAVVNKVMADWYDLSFEEVAQLESNIVT